MNHAVSRTIKIGVTGPSDINENKLLKERVENILSKIDKKLSQTPYELIVISPMSRGVDRFLTQEIINFKGSSFHMKTLLEIISQNDLEMEGDSDDFHELLDLSTSKRTLNEVLTDEIYQGIAEDYSHAGELVVDKCDCLIAIWDEKKSPNGHTASIVKYARLNSIPVFVINPNSTETAHENNAYSFWLDLEYLNIYNTENVDLKKIEAGIKEKEKLLNLIDLTKAEKEQIKNNILTPLAQANVLAMENQKWHYRSLKLVYYFSAGAVGVVGLQLIFLPEMPQILVLEALMMISIISLYLMNKKQSWHRKWIDYRYLAERLRAATIFALAGLECNVLEHLPHQRSGDDWTLQAYNSIYQKQLETPCKKLDFQKKKDFVLDNWIKDQKDYYLRKSAWHGKRDTLFNRIIFISFGLTAVFALFHAFGAFWHSLEIPLVSEVMTWLVIFLPAIAASCAGIKVQREYLRISKRYVQMAEYLKTVEYAIEKLTPGEEDKMVEILENANQMMLREHQDWRAIFSVRDAELP